jgi:hypothetical protein
VDGFTDAVNEGAARSAKGVDKGRKCGLAVGCEGEEFHQRWQLQTWLRRKVRWLTTKKIYIETKGAVKALVGRRGRGERKRKEKLRPRKEKWRPAEGRKQRTYR